MTLVGSVVENLVGWGWTLNLGVETSITSHLNGFFPSWNFKVSLSCERSFAIFTLKWLFSFMNCVNVFLQNNSINKSRTTHVTFTDGFFHSWNLASCLFKLTYWVNAVLQILHWNGFFFSWNLPLHIWHLNVLFPSWTFLTPSWHFFKW